jgi:diamine N-acetyltransferase
MELKVKRFSKNEVELRVNWVNNSKINKQMTFELPATIQKTLLWCKTLKNRDNRVDFSFFNEKGLCVGMAGLVSICNKDKNAEFYVMINPDCHRKGYGKQVSEWLFNYGFSVLNLHKIYLYTNDDNIAAYKIYESYNFKLEGILREHKSREGAFLNRRFYGLLKSEWQDLNWKKNINEKF